MMNVAGGISGQHDWNKVMSCEYFHYCDHRMDEKFLKRFPMKLTSHPRGNLHQALYPFYGL